MEESPRCNSAMPGSFLSVPRARRQLGSAKHPARSPAFHPVCFRQLSFRVRFRAGSNISARLPNWGRDAYSVAFLRGWMGLQKLANALFLLTLSLTLAGCSSWVPLRVTTQPSNQTVVAGQTVTFSVAAAELVKTEPPL